MATHGFGDRGDRVVPHRRLVAKYWERLPIVVTPASSAWDRIRSGGGKPIMKSPMCG